MSHSVKQHLRLEIEVYDRTIRTWIPGYEQALKRAAGEVARVQPRRVLDLGAGTGALSEAILKQSATATVELLDLDEEMLAQARVRLKSFGERARFRRQSFLDPLPECDAVAASLALHHVPAMTEKKQLYRRILEALVPGGLLVNADVTMPAGEPRRSEDYAKWAAHLVSCGIGKHRAYEHFREWAGEDTYFPLEMELEAMTEAGFDAACAWRDIPNTLIIGRKP
ncbi:MAG: methyltransferase domain-containing protein [Gammaproteobacteria bacterium]|nr:methyltransferase domain-containing protein [Gammaproteobacteria bacterium]MXW44856.1 class I SAM-dependent methyltransferase [Gammaproteobacteria bacterium]MYD02017.1 class I SAM-dependent methyltransferase [Gammaproteobacteria bacterium]MYI24052.1 class I SAM-dependent methyltransferase [Gammaproteobacteria bacterium]